MRAMCRVGLMGAFFVLASAVLFGCGGGSGQTGNTDSTTAQSTTTAPSVITARNQTTLQSGTTFADSGQNGAQVETAVSGMPADFPADIPVHPGTVTAYDKTEVTKSTTVHQLTVKTTASLADVIAWYKTQLPAGWSVGFLEEKDGQAKIALNGGSYAPASPEGRGGGVIIGLFEGDGTQIVTSATAMAQ